MSTNESNFELYLGKGCRVVTSEESGIEPFLLYATNKYRIQRSMGGAQPEMFQKRFDCVEFMEEDSETSSLISTIQQVLCILNVFNTTSNKVQFSLMIHCGFKKKEKSGLDKCYPYDLLELSYLRDQIR